MIFALGLATGIWILALALHLFGTYYALNRFESRPPHLDAPFTLYPVSILKPLKGLESGTYENLESFFHLDYSCYELLFSVADPKDPVCGIVRSLIEKYPFVSAQLLVTHTDIGPNPKVNNLVDSYGKAQHDLILISDSNIRVKPDYLRRLVAHLDNSVGVITAVVAGIEPRSLGGHLEAMCLNTFYARGMQLASAFGKRCVLGKSMMFRRSVAKRFGGIQTLARYLAEDYMAGIAMEQLGLQVVIMSDPVEQYIGQHEFSAFWSRHLRWGRIRKAQAPLAFAIEPFLGSVVSGCLGVWALHSWLHASLSSLILVHAGVWALGDLLLVRRLTGDLRIQMPIAWAIRELSGFPLWLHIAVGRTVLWRGRKLAIQSGGLLETN